MSRIPPFLATFIVVLAVFGAGCESKSAKLQKCHATCDDLDREYRAQCTEPDVEGCLGNVEQHYVACGRICAEEAKR